MENRQIIVFILFQIWLHILPVRLDCVPFNSCSTARKYVDLRILNEPKTIRIFRSAHCGGPTEAKIFCEMIPDPDCVMLEDCPQALELIQIKGRKDPELMKLLLSAACGGSLRRNMLFCDRIQINKTDLLPKMDVCSIQTLAKLSAGEKAELDEYAWTALLKYRNKSTGNTSYRCHGSLISKKYVVTAAHCLQQNARPESVVLGEYDTSQTNDCIEQDCADPIQEFPIESVHLHPKFQSEGVFNDIGLIRLKGIVNFSDFVKPICLPPIDLNFQEDEQLFVTGWGKTENRTSSPVKLKAQIYYLTNLQCLNRVNMKPDESQICAGSDNGADTCKGDSGGPLMALRTVDREKKMVLAGVVSWGSRCGSRAAFYTKVSKFVNWILETMQP